MEHLEEQVNTLVAALVERAVTFNWPGYPTMGLSPDRTSIVWRSPMDPSGWNTGGVVIEGKWNDGRWTAIRSQHDDATRGKEKVLPWDEMLKDCTELNMFFTGPQAYVNYFKSHSLSPMLARLNDMAPWHAVSSNQWLKNTWMDIWSSTPFECDIVECLFKDASDDDWYLRVRDLAEAFNKADSNTHFSFQDKASKRTLRTSDMYAWAMVLTWKYKDLDDFVLLPNLTGELTLNNGVRTKVRDWEVLYTPDQVQYAKGNDPAMWRALIEFDASVFQSIRPGLLNSITLDSKAKQKYALRTLAHAALDITVPVAKENMYDYWRQYLFEVVSKNEQCNDSTAFIILSRLHKTWWGRKNCPQGAALLDAFNVISPIPFNADSWMPGKDKSFELLQLLEGMCSEVSSAIIPDGQFDLS